MISAAKFFAVTCNNFYYILRIYQFVLYRVAGQFNI